MSPSILISMHMTLRYVHELYSAEEFDGILTSKASYSLIWFSFGGLRDFWADVCFKLFHSLLYNLQ